MKTPVLLILMLSALGATAQPVYRCGSEYSQSPCPQARVVDAADARSDAQRAAASRVAADEKQSGTRMEHERLAMLSAQKPGGAVSLSGMPSKAAAAQHPKKPKWVKLKTAKKARAQA
jgi:hypothetical protein